MMNFRRRNGTDDDDSHEDTHQKGLKVQVDFPGTTPFWILGVLLGMFLFFLWVKANPELLTGFKTSLFKKETVSSTTTGEFQLASDLYTARSHVCDVLLYQDGKREMTMILRYHVNVFYDMNLVSIRVLQQPEDESQDTKRIEVRLPDETMEVVPEKYAGLTGYIADGELPGIEVFDMKGKFQAKEDDQLAEAFLSLYHENGQRSVSALLKEDGTVADVYLPYTSMLIENEFSSDLNKKVQEKRLQVVSEARTSVVSGIGKYFNAIGFEDVVVLDARGNEMAQ